jgi:hypothetical protein
MRDACADFRAELREFNGEPDHVHLLVNFPPTMTISHLVNSRKGVPSHGLRLEFPELSRHYRRPRGYGPGPTSPAPWVVHPSPSCATTSSSRTARPSWLTQTAFHHGPEGRRTGGPFR